MAARLHLVPIAALLLGCFDPGDGVAPPDERVYFPVGLALDRDARFLYVANSDFDLQFNAGTLQSFDLDALRARVPRSCSADNQCDGGQFCDLVPTRENGDLPSARCLPSDGPYAGMPCGAFGERSPGDKLLHPGRCGYVDPVNVQDGGPPILVDSVRIGAFARDLIYRANPDGFGGRLFATVAGDATLHWVDTDGPTLQCGQGNNDGACDDRHRTGDDPEAENTRGLRLLPEPYGLDATEDGRAILVSNQTSGAVSLFINDWSDAGPRLEFAVGDLPDRPIGVANVSAPLASRLVPDYAPGFLVTFRNSPNVALVKVYDDIASDPPRPFARTVGSSPISTNSVGADSRGIAVDPGLRLAAERECVEQFGADVACLENQDCAPGLTDCLNEAAAVPLDVYVANRTPSSLLAGQTRPVSNATSSDELPAFNASIPLSAGPSRVVLGSIINEQGELERRVFVVCFDSRRIFIFDPVRREIEAEVWTGRGPHGLAVDSAHGLAYVGHFTDSYIGVIALDQRFPETYATVVTSIGLPVAPRASK